MLVRIAVLLAALACTGALAGCGGDGAGDAAPAAAATGIPTAASHARGASFEAPPEPSLPKVPAGLHELPPDPFGGASPDEPAPAPAPKPGVNL